MKNDERNYTILLRELTKEEIFSLFKQLAEEYANSEDDFSWRRLCSKYNLAISCVEKIKEITIVYNLISEDTIKKMMIKSSKNLNAANSKDKYSFRSEDNYKALLRRRIIHAVNSMEDEDIVSITKKFASSIDLPKYAFYDNTLVWSRAIFDLTIRKALICGLVDEVCFSCIRFKSILHSVQTNRAYTENYFDYLKLQKKEYKALSDELSIKKLDLKKAKSADKPLIRKEIKKIELSLEEILQV